MTQAPLASPKTLLTVDLGTQSLRVSALSTTGERLWTWRRPIASSIDGEIFEQDPAEWLAAVEDGMAEAATAGIRPDALIATGPLAGFVALDVSGRALTRAVMYSDRRSAIDLPTAEQAIARDGPPETAGLRAYVPDPLPHALRLRRLEPAVAARTRHLLDATGFLAHALSGEATLNPHTALRLHGGAPARALGIDPSLFGRQTRLAEIIGTLRPELASRFGFGHVPIVAATFDSKCAYAASGIARPGEALDISGTVTSFGVIADRPIVDSQRRIYSLPFAEGWLVRGSTASSGGILEWARRELLASDFDALDAAAARVAPGAGGMLFLPYHAGERAPLWNPHARGALLGMSLDSDKAAMARAVYEGLAFALRHIVSVIEDCGANVRDIRLAGGLAQNRLLSQIKADTLGLPLLQLRDLELTSLGLAVIGSVALGAAPDFATASRRFVATQARIEPNPEHKAAYDRHFARYLAAVEALGPTFVAEPATEPAG